MHIPSSGQPVKLNPLNPLPQPPKKLEPEETAYKETSSSVAVDELQVFDERRKTQIQNQIEERAKKRPSAMTLLFNIELHGKAVEAQRPNLQDKEKYTIYLSQLYGDIRFLENVFLDSRIDLTELFRTEKINQDLQALKNKNVIFLKKHQERFLNIAMKPHQIIAHLAVHYLGFLFGGQKIAVEMEKKWGSDVSHLYEFCPNSKVIKENFLKSMDQYIETLLDKEFEEFKQELVTAWEFVCDLQNVEPEEPQELFKD